ncbi:MAG: methyltransferase domain-containing protein [Chloroflexi bacterium]|nr:methyltransferase domain-containing protein [Chloroflexota bacterium]
MGEEKFKRRLIDQAQIRLGHRVLDLGCGTGTLTIRIKQMHPEADVVGLDGDTGVLAIARAKTASIGVSIGFVQGLAFQLPYPDAAFDRVLSSLVFHHLTTDNKIKTLRECFRVLKPGGELHIADFGKPFNTYTNLLAPVMEKAEEVSANIQGLLPQMMLESGFTQVAEPAHYTTIFGGLSLYRARKLG